MPLPSEDDLVARKESALETPDLGNIDSYGDAWIGGEHPRHAGYALDSLHARDEAIQIPRE